MLVTQLFSIQQRVPLLCVIFRVDSFMVVRENFLITVLILSDLIRQIMEQFNGLKVNTKDGGKDGYLCNSIFYA